MVAVPDVNLRVLLYQLVQELLLNIVKHAGTARARIVAGQAGRRIRVLAEDEGSGHDPAALEEAGVCGVGVPRA